MRWRKFARIATVALAAAALSAALSPAAAHAAAPNSLVVWSGGLGPDDPLTGVLLRTDGTGDLLAASPADRRTGKVQTVGSFTLNATQLATVNAAAQAAVAGPGFNGAGANDGSYAMAVANVGGTTRTVLGRNAASPQLRTLIADLDAALPATHQLVAPPVADVHAAAAGGAHAAEVPFVPDTCPAGLSAVDIDKDLSLQDAAKAKIVTLSPKGGFSGDQMGVDATWKNTKAPVTVKIRIEVTNPAGDGTDYASQIEKVVEGRLNGQKITSGPEKGEQIRFDLDVRQHVPGQQPLPCFDQVRMVKKPGFRSYVDGYGDGDVLGGNKQPHGAEWATDDPASFAHETLHLVGFDDRYTDQFVTKGGKVVPLPETGLEGDALAAALKPYGVTPSSGYLRSKATPAGKNHIMGDGARTGKIKLGQADLKKLAAQADLRIHADPGDLLLNKNRSEQDFGVGAPFDLLVRKGGKAHVNGMVVYCIDRFRGVPSRGGGFDVLGPAGAQGSPDLAALARVLQEVAAREPAPLAVTPGGQRAIWRVTDNLDPGSDSDTLAILRAAGIDPEQEFNFPRFNDPNAGHPGTAAVSQTRVLPALRTLPRLRLPSPRLVRALLAGTPPGAGAGVLLAVQVELARADGVVKLALQKRAGRGWRTLRRYARQRMAVGGDLLALPAPKLSPGIYRVLVTLGGKSLAASFRVR